MVSLEFSYSHAKEWHKSFIIVFGSGLEFSVSEADRQEVTTQALWDINPEDHEIMWHFPIGKKHAWILSIPGLNKIMRLLVLCSSYLGEH